SLAAEPMLVDFVAAIGGHARLFDPGKEFRKVITLERRLMLLQEAHHLLGNVALVEAVARRNDAGGTPLALVCTLSLDHPGERVCKSWELDRVTGVVHRPVGLEPIALVIGPVGDELLIARNRGDRARPQWKPIPGILSGPRRNFLEAHGAPLFENG